MQRSRETIFDHVFRLQVGKGRVQALEAIEVLKDRLHQLVDSVGRYIVGRDKTGAHTRGVDDYVGALIHAGGDLRC